MQLALDLLFPPRCTGCGKRGAWFCTECVGRVAQRDVVRYCERCDSPLVADRCAHCSRWSPDLAGIRVVGSYTKPLRPAIIALKFEGCRQVAQPLGTMLADIWRIRGKATVDAIVPVPMPEDRQAERGYNQSELLATICARHLGLPLLARAVQRTRVAPPQHGLDARTRRANAAGLFACAEPAAVTGRTLLIVDDVTTTGATLEAVAVALRGAGALAAWGLVLAQPAPYERT